MEKKGIQTTIPTLAILTGLIIISSMHIRQQRQQQMVLQYTGTE